LRLRGPVTKLLLVAPWLRLALLAIAVAICSPARLGALLATDAGTMAAGPGCHGTPPEQGEVGAAAGTLLESDDDDDFEWDGDDGFIPVVSDDLRPPRPVPSWALAPGLTPSSGVSGSLFRPPRATG
jgi:hypothetical protein